VSVPVRDAPDRPRRRKRTGPSRSLVTLQGLGGDLFYWPPGHTVRVGADAEVILFSPQREHSEVIDHMLKKMAG